MLTFKKYLMSFSLLIILPCFVLIFTSPLKAQDVMLAIGDSSGYPGSPGNQIGVAMSNLSESVRSLQMDIVDDGDYLTCIACTPDQYRAPGFQCLTNELASGACRVILMSTSTDIITTEEGLIFTVNYSVTESAPAGLCEDLTPANETVSGSDNQALAVVSDTGEFCFTLCTADENCDDGNGCTSDTCETGQCVHECDVSNALDPCCANQACLSEPVCTDGDYDSDGIPDDEDNCPYIPNELQENSDSDSHGDACDNCPYTDNEDQNDSDGDDIGDACEENNPCGDVWPPATSPGAMDCGDGIVDIMDIMAEVDFALNGEMPDGCQALRADVPTGTAPDCIPPDGHIDILDLLVLSDMAIGRQNCCSYYYQSLLPLISAIDVIDITATTATITWTTDKPGDSRVVYGFGTYYPQVYDDQLVTSHAITLTDLFPHTMYYYKVFSTDDFGNSSESETQSFTTLSPNSDCGPELHNGIPASGTITTGEEDCYYIDLPAGQAMLNVELIGSNPDADLYLRYDEPPTTLDWDCRSYTGGSDETCSISSPAENRWYIMVRGYAGTVDYQIVATYSLVAETCEVRPCDYDSSEACQCDPACEQYGDCCPDKCDFCPCPIDSCEGRPCDYESSEACQCDSTCEQYGDCCPDKCDFCPCIPTDSCEGRCDTQAPAGCYCDPACINYGDCCPDACDVCGYCAP